MWFIFNIAMLVIFIITRIFCIITTFKALKYDEYFYEGNPIVRKILNCHGGKILAVIFGLLFLFISIVLNFILQIIYPKDVWVLTIPVFIMLPFLTYDFVINLVSFRDYRKIKSELKEDD